MRALRLATRGSPQASTQAGLVAAAITAATGRPTELVTITTTGDRKSSVPLHTIGGQGVFTKEVQVAVLDGRGDVAVHSAKDLPTTPAPGLEIGAFCARRDPADALVGRRLHHLAPGATVASGSVRRRALLADVRPDLQFVELRGNIARRLEQLPAGGAIVMAVAALEILGLADRVAERLDPMQFVPAVGQGCVAVECRDGDREVLAALAAVDDAPTRMAVTVERAFLAELGSGCALPIGAHVAGGLLRTFLAGDGGTSRERVALTGDLATDVDLARAAAARALSAATRGEVAGS